MSERGALPNTGFPTPGRVDPSPGYRIIPGGMGGHLHGGVSPGSPGVSAHPGGSSNRSARTFGRSGFNSGGSRQTPEWYRKLAVGLSTASGVAVIVIYIATRGGVL